MNKIRGFEVVDNQKRKNETEIKLPTRATEYAAAYDFYSPIDMTIKPYELGMIWTDIKAYMNSDEALLINVRSSMGKHPVMLANTQGWIDADYYGNPDNDGNIGIRILNLGKEDYNIKAGDRIAQGMFINTLAGENGNTNNKRVGGFGSTN